MRPCSRAITLGLVAAAAFLLIGLDAVQLPSFSSGVTLVQLDVSVRANGRAVEGLRADDFEVRDNGARQRVTSVAYDEAPVNVMLAFDSSRSVDGAKLTELRAAAHGLFDLVTPRDTVAVLGFSNRVVLRVPFTTDRQQLDAGLTSGVSAGDTALADALHTALVLSDGRAGRPVIIVFTDGIETGSFLTAEQVVETARRTRAVVYAVVAGNRGGDGLLANIVRATGGRRFDVAAGGLTETFAEVLAASKQRYLLSYEPEGVTRAGWHELSVSVPSMPTAQVEARPGYLARD